MKQWEIYEFPDPSGTKSHPCVIISPNALAENPKYVYVNVIPCQTLYSGQEQLPGDVILLEDDGLERKSVAKCLYVLFYRKDQVGRRYGEGTVQMERRRAICAILAKLFVPGR